MLARRSWYLSDLSIRHNNEHLSHIFHAIIVAIAHLAAPQFAIIVWIQRTCIVDDLVWRTPARPVHLDHGNCHSSLSKFGHISKKRKRIRSVTEIERFTMRQPPSAEGMYRLRPTPGDSNQQQQQQQQRQPQQQNASFDQSVGDSTITSKGQTLLAPPDSATRRRFVVAPETEGDARILRNLDLEESKTVVTKATTKTGRSKKSRKSSRTNKSAPAGSSHLDPEFLRSIPKPDQDATFTRLKSKLHKSKVIGELLQTEVEERKCLEMSLREDLAEAKKEVKGLLLRTQKTMELVQKEQKAQAEVNTDISKLMGKSALCQSCLCRAYFVLSIYHFSTDSNLENTKADWERKKRVQIEEEFEKFKRETQTDIQKLIDLHKKEEGKLVDYIKDVDKARVLEIENRETTEEVLERMKKHLDELSKQLEVSEKNRREAEEKASTLKEEVWNHKEEIRQLNDRLQQQKRLASAKTWDLDPKHSNSILANDSSPQSVMVKQIYSDQSVVRGGKSNDKFEIASRVFGNGASSYIDRVIKPTTQEQIPDISRSKSFAQPEAAPELQAPPQQQQAHFVSQKAQQLWQQQQGAEMHLMSVHRNEPQHRVVPAMQQQYHQPGAAAAEEMMVQTTSSGRPKNWVGTTITLHPLSPGDMTYMTQEQRTEYSPVATRVSTAGNETRMTTHHHGAPALPNWCGAI